MARLNTAQQQAVEHGLGPMLVLAGAGSGKTRVITERIARLIAEGTRPESILGFSFTNKAAAEMSERLLKLTGPKGKNVWLSTFHSFGVRFLKEELHRVDGDGKFVIFDQGDTLGLVREILRQERAGERDLDAMAILSRISLYKNAFLAPEDVKASDYEYDAVAADVYPSYEAKLRAMRAVDFDDLVVRPVRILREREDIRERWRRRFTHLLVDEFQDTNRSQLELTRALVNDLGNVCVVGDDDQSIYGWRGADVGNILEFDKQFKGTKVVKLEENYRSVSQILDVANAAIARAKGKRHDKQLRQTRGEGDKVKRCEVVDPTAEARVVVTEIRRLVHDEGLRFRDISILYRSNLQARLLEEELRVGGVPYRLFGGQQFFDRKEVKDAIAYLRCVVHPSDEISLRRVINYPPRGIGDRTVERIHNHAVGHGVSFTKAFGIIDQLGAPDGAVRGSRRLQAAFAAARRSLKSGQGKLSSHARQLFKDVGLETYIKSDEKTGAKRWHNIEFLLRSIARYEEMPDKERPSINAFLTRITLRFEQEAEETPNKVTLSTLHASKGLEFPAVFLLGLVEGQLPHLRTTDPKATEASPTDVEEERRLFYVGVTRARDRLYLMIPKRKMFRGKAIELTPSRFLEGLPEDAVEAFSPPAAQAVDHDEMVSMASALLAQLRSS